MKTELYTIDESEIIIKHYQNILKNEKISYEPIIIIHNLTTKQYGKKYRIICQCNAIPGITSYIVSIETALDILNLPQPSEILSPS